MKPTPKELKDYTELKDRRVYVVDDLGDIDREMLEFEEKFGAY